VQETEEDMRRLEELLARSIEQAGPFLRRSFQMPEHSLSARQLVHHLQGVPTVAFATVTARGEPRVAPIGALFVRGRFHIPTVESAARTRHVLQQPAVSLSYQEGTDVGIIVHGTATVIGEGHREFAMLEEIHRALIGESVSAWGSGAEGAFLRVEANRFYTFARYPERLPDGEA
jgi:hypothetical protein